MPNDPAGRESGHAASALLEILALPESSLNPSIRTLALDTIEVILPGITSRPLLKSLAERLCLMDRPPPSLLRLMLNRGEKDIAVMLLLDARLPESLLLEIAETADVEILSVLARRRRLSTAACEALLRRGETRIMLELLRNRNAIIEEHGYWPVVRRARREAELHAPLVTREDLPAAVAFELFWHLNAMQRRFVISRFLSDSELLERILPVVRPAARAHADDRALGIERMVSLIGEGDLEAAARELSRITGLHREACGRIVSDSSGEPLTIALRAMGYQRRLFADLIRRLLSAPASPLRGDRKTEELCILFDTLSTNKSWVMLMYWHWSALRVGPYADADPAERSAQSADAEDAGERTAVRPGPDREENTSTENGDEAAAVRPSSPEPEKEEEEEDAIAGTEETARSGEPAEEEEPDAGRNVITVGTATGKERDASPPTSSVVDTSDPEEIEEDEAESRAPASGPTAGDDDERTDQEEPDDPMKRIEALLRQLQAAL